MEENKQWYLSKRFWSNLILLLVAFLTAMQQNELFSSMPGFLAFIGSAVAMLNIILGAFSSQSKLQVPVLTSILERLLSRK